MGGGLKKDHHKTGAGVNVVDTAAIKLRPDISV